MIPRFVLFAATACLCLCNSPIQAQVIEAEYCFVEDLNDDGVWDMLFVDEDGDGKIDEHIYHPNGFYFYPIWRGGIVDPVDPPNSATPSVDCQIIDEWMNSREEDESADLDDGFVEYEKKTKEKDNSRLPDRQ